VGSRTGGFTFLSSKRKTPPAVYGFRIANCVAFRTFLRDTIRTFVDGEGSVLKTDKVGQGRGGPKGSFWSDVCNWMTPNSFLD